MEEDKIFFESSEDLEGFLGYCRYMAKPSFWRRSEAKNGFRKKEAISRRVSSEIGYPTVDAWLTIAYEYASYLYQIQIHFLERFQSGPCDLTKAVSPIIGGAAADYSAVCRLVDQGFDAPARTVLRSMLEKIETVYVLIGNSELVLDYHADSIASREFWYRNIRAGRSLQAKLDVMIRLELIDDVKSHKDYWESRYNTLDPFKHSNREAGGVSMLTFGSGREFFEPSMVGIRTIYSTDTLRTTVAAVADLSRTFAELARQDDPLGMAPKKLSKARRDIAAFHSIAGSMWDFIARHQNDPLLAIPDDRDDRF